MQCKTLSKAQILERREEMDEEEQRAPTSSGRPESIMWDMMLSGPLRLLEKREKSMKKNEAPPPPTSHGRPESIMQDIMLFGPPRLLGYVLHIIN